MSLEIGLIITLVLLIIFLLWQQSRHLQALKQREQNEKVIQALQAYPVHQYTMPHMLERSLAIIFSTPLFNLIPQGAIFLLQDGTLKLSTHRGLTGKFENTSPEITLSSCLCGITAETDRFQFIAAKDIRHRQHNPETPRHGHYIVPLIRQNAQIGLLTLRTSANYKITTNKIKFIKSLGITISSLIERKQVADELKSANNVLNLSQQAILITDKDNKIIRCNQACEQMTGYSCKELIGQSPRGFQSEHHTLEFYNQLRQELANNDFWQGETWNKRKDSSVFPTWLTISTIKNTDGQITQHLAFFTDLTVIKK